MSNVDFAQLRLDVSRLRLARGRVIATTSPHIQYPQAQAPRQACYQECRTLVSRHVLRAVPVMLEDRELVVDATTLINEEMWWLQPVRSRVLGKSACGGGGRRRVGRSLNRDKKS